MALMQLGIQNNYSKQPFLKKLSREVWWAKSRTTWQTKSQGRLSGFGEADPALPDQQNPVSWALRSQVFIPFKGAGLLLGIDCPWVTHVLLKHVDWYSWSNWQWVPILSIPRAPTDTAGGLEGTNRMGRPCQLESLWHPPLDPAECPRTALFMNKNITWQKCIMNSVKYHGKRYKIQGTMVWKQLTCTSLKSLVWQWPRSVETT